MAQAFRRAGRRGEMRHALRLIGRSPNSSTMDITLIRTFIEVAATGSFVGASERLFVTQSAVSLRVQRLEDSLGQTLFTRSKAGAELTPAGREFERYAISLLKIWEEARQQVAIPAGFRKSLSIGAQYSLWPRLGFRWLDRMREDMADLSIRAEVGMPDRLMRMLIEGVVQVALMYSPQLRPGLIVKPVIEEEMIMVASWPNPNINDLEGRYAFVDWGPEFVHAHSQHLPNLTNPGLTLSLGALSGEFIVRRKFAAYLPARYVKRMVDAGQLHLVPDAPAFPYPVWAAWRDDLDPEIARVAEAALTRVAQDIDQEQVGVMDQLEAVSTDGPVETLGDIAISPTPD